MIENGRFSLELSGQLLEAHRMIQARVVRDGVVRHQATLAYGVLEEEELTLDGITSDDHINVTEAQSQAVTISGQARTAQSVLVTVGEKVWTAPVTTGRYHLEVPGHELVTNGSYQVRVSSGHKTETRSYTVAPEATNQIRIEAVEALNSASDTVRISGSLRLEGLAARYHNDLFIDTVKLELNGKTYTTGLGQARTSTALVNRWRETVKDKDFSFDIPVADLKMAEGKELVFSLPDDHHVIYDAKLGTYDDSPRRIETSRPVISDQSKYRLNTNPWLTNGTDKTIVLPPADKAIVSGRVSGNAQQDDEVAVRIGDQVYLGQVGSDKQFVVTVDQSALQTSGQQVITATLKGKDYAGQAVTVSDSMLYFGNHVTNQSDFVAKFETGHVSEDRLAYFIKGIRHELYNSYGHLAKQPIGNDRYHLTYHFIENSSGAVNFTDAEKAMVRQVLDEFSSHTRLTFSEKPVLDPKDTPDISFHQIFSHDGRSRATIGGSVYMNAPDVRVTDAGYALMMHETMHSLGAADVKDEHFGHENGYITTVMTYNLRMVRPDAKKPLRMLDLMHLHYRYGVNPDQRKEDNTYTFKRHTSYQIDDSSYIWDGAGVDTFDASMEDKPVTVDLTPGSWIFRGDKTRHFWAEETKEFHRRPGTFFNNTAANYEDTNIPSVMVYNEDQAFISHGTQIERLIGSKHDDVLRGNVAANDILGGAGADQIWGGAGDDYIDGGAGADQMNGGDGNDTFIVDDLGDRVTESSDQGQDLVISSVDYDLPEHVEDLTLTGTAELGYGNSLANRITGNSVANTLRGNGGADTFVFNSPLNGQIDEITDFGTDDTIELSSSIFADVDTNRVLEYIIYDSQTGSLSYDTDGKGQTDRIQFAQLPRGLAVTTNQIVIR